MPSKKENPANKGPRGPYRMDERLKLVKAAREMGAIKVEVDGIKVEFGDVTHVIREGGSYRDIFAQTPIPPNLEYLAKSGESKSETPEPSPEPAISSGPHPDEFSRQTDLWASYRPLGR